MSLRRLSVPITYLAQRFQFINRTLLPKRPTKVPSISVFGINNIQNVRYLSSSSNPQSDEIKENHGEKVKFSFITHKGEQVDVEGECGQTIKTVAENYDSVMEGACEGVLACTTCHVYVPDELADAFEEPKIKEEDLLDTAAFLKPNSRLSCQLVVSKKIEGAQFSLPKGTVNMQVDGFQPKKH